MKFANVLLFASFAFASPFQVEPRDQTAVSTITDAVKALSTATDKSRNEIEKAVKTAKGSVAASAKVTATITAEYKNILKALKEATTSITKVTTGSAGGIAQSAKGLGKQQISQLEEALKTTKRIISGLEATIDVTVTDLKPQTYAAVRAEVELVKKAIAPFLEPLITYANAAKKASASAGVGVNGLDSAVKEIGDLLKKVAKSIGVPGLSDISGLVGKPGLSGAPSLGSKGPK